MIDLEEMCMHHRFLSLLLALLLTAPALLSGCGGNASETTADTASADTAAEETETAILRSADLLPDTDFGGADYVIIGREYAKLGELPAMEFVVEELTGDIINDTIFKRNQTVEENFNVNITAMTGDAGALVKTSVTAGDGAYDLSWAHVNTMSTLSLNGHLANYYDVPHIDMTGAWWNRLAVESLTQNGKCFLQMNYIPFTGVMLSHVLFFNMDMVNEYGLTSPYTHVNENTWTFDTFAAMVETVSVDKNGDGTQDAGDIYGLLSSHGTSGVAFAVGMDVQPLTFAADGSFTLSLLSDRNQSILESIVSLTHTPASWLITDYSKENDLAKMFAAGQGLFYSGFMTDAYQFFRDMEQDYGLIVFPKWEASDDYITTVTGGTGLLGIPMVTADMDRTGLITEALAIESYYDVYPAVFETVINSKLLRDEDSQKMFRLLMDGLEISFARTYKQAQYTDLFADLTAAGSTDLASKVASLESTATEHYNKVLESFAD